MPNSILSILSSKSRHFDSSKWNLWIDLDGTIDLHCPRLKFLHDSHRTVNILSEHTGRETEIRVVGPFNGFVFSLESIDNDNRSKNLFLLDRGTRFRIHENRRLDKQSLLLAPFSATRGRET